MEHTHDVKAVVWHPVEEILASFSYDDTIRLWKEDDDDWYSAATLTGHGSTVWGGAFSADGGFLASVSDDRTIRVWAKEANKSEGAQEDGFYYRPEISYKCIAVVPNAIHKRAIYSVSWSAPSRSTGTEPSNLGYLATGCGDNSLRIFEVTPGKDESSPLLDIKLVVERGNAHGLNDINCVKWNPVHPGWLATAGDDGVIRIWYLEQ
ncbi:WD40 repeat-like protein [Martensiomyces pterosporus]|nr:WD40 repeat-like protein [Martensiomyces pterosporus]